MICRFWGWCFHMSFRCSSRYMHWSIFGLAGRPALDFYGLLRGLNPLKNYKSTEFEEIIPTECVFSFKPRIKQPFSTLGDHDRPKAPKCGSSQPSNLAEGIWWILTWSKQPSKNCFTYPLEWHQKTKHNLHPNSSQNIKNKNQQNGCNKFNIFNFFPIFAPSPWALGLPSQGPVHVVMPRAAPRAAEAAAGLRQGRAQRPRRLRGHDLGWLVQVTWERLGSGWKKHGA